MFKKFTELMLLSVGAILAIVPANAQEPVNRELYPDYAVSKKVDWSLHARKATLQETRPDHINNAESKYFPPIFNQVSGSCGSASSIAYMFTHEINCVRDADASLPENQYPTHFTWLLTFSNSSKEEMAVANGIPNSITYGGFPISSLFGSQEASSKDFGWMQGYDKWYAAMFNRASAVSSFPISVETEEGREDVKNWLWNHNGDLSLPAGGICGIGVAIIGSDIRSVPKTPVNNAIENKASTGYIVSWGPQVDHAMTIVGYDDRIEFDLDGNGVFGEKDKDEVGAWIIANSWGNGWWGKGFVYCPYKNAVSWKEGKDYYKPGFYVIRRDYRPLRTLKLKMEYSRRSELKLMAGISSDVNATEPEKTIEFEHFKYAGNGTNEHDPEPEVPMLGRWVDGMHYEPMEFGYDLTDLSAKFDTRKTLKYFFIIESKANAIGEGKVHTCSLMDYEFDEKGVEIPFDMDADGVTIQNQGNKTIITMLVKGEPFYAPDNVIADAEGNLTWDAPATSSYELAGYNVYVNGEMVKRVDASATSCATDVALEGGRSVAAVYISNGKEFLSKKVAAYYAGLYFGLNPGSKNMARSISNSGFVIKDIFKPRYDQMTMEFWLRPNNCVSYNQHIGPGWGNFLFHTTSNSQLVVGWDTGNRISSANNVLKSGQWQHVAVVVDGGKMVAYVNGENVGEITTNKNGIGGFGDLSFGCEGNSGINGRVDEVRIWNVARTQREIQGMMYAEVADPMHTSGLLFEAKMSDKSTDPISDATGKYVVENLEGTHSRVQESTLFTDKRALKAGISLPQGPFYVGVPVKMNNTSSGNAVKFEWSHSDAPEKVYESEEPSFVFNTVGEKTIKLTVQNASGKTVETETVINVSAAFAPEASFVAPESVAVDEHVSFANTTTHDNGCTYMWTMEGAEVESSTSTNVGTTYKRPGTYTVTLTATSPAGTSTCSKTIEVKNLPPVADFSVPVPTILKGQKTKLVSESTHNPETFAWAVTDAGHHNVYYDESPDVMFEDPGVYDVSLTVSNLMGQSRAIRHRAVIVCNADAKNGLNFTGNETVTFPNPVDFTVSDGFTVDWWMYSKTSDKSTQHIGGENKYFNLYAEADGVLAVYLNNRVFRTDAGFITPSQWHHYGVVFNKEEDGKVHIYAYKDGKLVNSFTRVGLIWPTVSANLLSLGSEAAPLNAIVDEFRIWNSALSQEQLYGFANCPIADVAKAEAENKLALYYDFNQNGGDVVDATSGKHTGIRSGFGPDGDAWPSTLGVFCLSNTQREDVTAKYLTNYKAPFLSVENSYTCEGSTRYQTLLQDEEKSRWITENSIVSGNTVTGVSVDSRKDSTLVFVTGSSNFENQLEDFKLYETVTIPAGHYVFTVYGAEGASTAKNHIVVAKGQGLPDLSELEEKSLAYALVNAGEVNFVLNEETEVSLGLLINQRNVNTQTVTGFSLERKKTNDDFTGTGVVPVFDESAVSVNAGKGMIVLSSSVSAPSSVHTLSGVCVYRGIVNGTKQVNLPAGVYIVNGNKYIVR